MDRLTVKNEEGFDYSKESLLKFDERGCITGYSDYCLQIVWKLAEYENIGLEPYQLRELDKLYLEKCEEVNKLNKELVNCKQTEEQGLLLRLPCKVGDAVWYVDNDDDNYPLELLVWKIEINNVHILYCAIEKEDCDSFGFTKDDIGKTIFFTREEAEQALKQMGG